MKRTAAFVGALGGFGLAFVLADAAFRDASAQRIDPGRPSSLVVGPPPGPAPMLRVDARRSGRASDGLPVGTLKIAWKKATGLSVEHPALAVDDGMLALVSTRGEVAFLAADGDARSSAHVGASLVGPATMSSAGTLAFFTSHGEIAMIRPWSTRAPVLRHHAAELNVRAAPLGLDDGGAVFASVSELLMVDASGGIRARTTLPEPVGSPLLATGNAIVAVTERGAVFSWIAREDPQRVGSFGAPIDGSATLTSHRTLLAIIEQAQLIELDLKSATTTVRARARTGEVFLGPLAAAVANDGSPILAWLALSAGHTMAKRLRSPSSEPETVTLEVLSNAQHPASLDAGSLTQSIPSHVGPLIDARGTLAFATPDGRVGTLAPDGSVETLGEPPCSRGPRGYPSVAGLTPMKDRSFAITGTNGEMLRIVQARPDASDQRPSPGPSIPNVRVRDPGQPTQSCL